MARKSRGSSAGAAQVRLFSDLFGVAPHRWAVFFARWGNLLLLIGVTYWLLSKVASLIGWGGVLWLVLVVVAGIGWVPGIRRVVVARAWCLVTRNRMYLAFIEARIHSRTGRLPLLLRVAPTKVGERCLFWCPAGLQVSNFEDHASVLAAACWARDVRITGSKRFTHLVTVEVIRRDTLAASETVTPDLMSRVSAPRPSGPMGDSSDAGPGRFSVVLVPKDRDG